VRISPSAVTISLLEVVDRPTEPTRQVSQAAAEGQAGDANLGYEAEHSCQPVLLRRAVDVLEQTPGPDVRELGVGYDCDVAHAGHIERQAVLGDRSSAKVVASAFHAKEQPVVTCESHGRGDVVGRGRSEDERRDLSHHAVPDQYGIIPALIAGAQQRPLEARLQFVELL
jgi:hypothetical protein